MKDARIINRSDDNIRTVGLARCREICMTRSRDSFKKLQELIHSLKMNCLYLLSCAIVLFFMLCSIKVITLKDFIPKSFWLTF